MNKVITFQDNGQDFLTYEVTSKGKIVDVQPFQFSIWSQYKVVNMSNLKEGLYVDLEHLENKSKTTIKYPIEKIEDVIKDKDVSSQPRIILNPF